MKKLGMFQKFDFVAWQTGKKFMVASVRYNERRGCVTLSIAITEDKTDYGDKGISNVFEKFNVHLPKDTNENDVNKYAVGDNIIFKSIGKCAVFGEFNSNLSVEAVVEVVK